MHNFGDGLDRCPWGDVMGDVPERTSPLEIVGVGPLGSDFQFMDVPPTDHVNRRFVYHRALSLPGNRDKLIPGGCVSLSHLRPDRRNCLMSSFLEFGYMTQAKRSGVFL